MLKLVVKNSTKKFNREFKFPFCFCWFCSLFYILKNEFMMV